MTCLIDLPTEVLTEILYQCDNSSTLAQTCKKFASIAYSTPSLWSTVCLFQRHFTPDGPFHLRTKLLRARGAPLYVSVGLVTGYTDNVSALCKALAEHNAQISCFLLTAPTNMAAGGVISDIFPTTETFPALTILSVLSMRESPVRSIALWPQLDLVLTSATTLFPNLRHLFMNSFYDSVPMLPPSASFSHLSTLALEGSREQDIPDPLLIAALLNCTPQLESLWMKHHFGENFEDLVTHPIAYRTIKGRSGISLNIQLPRLKHLAVSVPGVACDLIACITAPALEDLHMDATRGPRHDGEWVSYTWSRWETESVHGAIHLLASRCPGVKRFAMTHVCLARTGWEWLFFGDEGRGPPFPKLECIALHELRRRNAVCDSWDGFDDKLLERFAREPRIPLRRLVFLNCDFPLSGSAITEAFRSGGVKELECDMNVPQWEDVEGKLTKWRELSDELGVSIRSWYTCQPDRWWTNGHDIDPTDGSAY
ncbi:hypothetical protein F5887DRAFT_1240689 [Amanita rubescens]|nr:hypothetical protein F5887DRAFT_1240689 [Amanita rubescens]